MAETRRTEGQRLLCALDVTTAEIGAATGATRQSAHRWRVGSSLPAPEYRPALEAAYGIPVDAWDTIPRGPVVLPPSRRGRPRRLAEPAHAAPVPVPRSARRAPPEMRAAIGAASTGTPGSRAEAEAQVDRLRELLATDGIAADVVVRAETALTRAIGQLDRIVDREEWLEDRIVREHPAYARAKRAIVEALRRHPKVLAEVEAALAEEDG